MDVKKPSSSSPPKWRKLIKNLTENANFMIFFILALVVGFIVIATLLISPLLGPDTDHLNFQLNDITISSFNISTPKTNFYFDVQFSICNHLDSHVFYSDFASSLSYKHETIARNSVPPFNHPKKSQMQVNATFVAKDVTFSDQRLVKSLLADMNRGVVTFGIATKIVTDVLIVSMDVVCEDVKVGFSSHNIYGVLGKLLGGPKNCNVYWLYGRWN